MGVFATQFRPELRQFSYAGALPASRSRLLHFRASYPLHDAAMRANGTKRPENLFQMLACRVVIMENRIAKVDFNLIIPPKSVKCRSQTRGYSFRDYCGMGPNRS
jgi:hypothetical protein